MKIGKFEITKQIKIIAIVALSAVLLIAAILGIGAIVGTGKKAQAQRLTTKNPKVAYYSEYLGTVQRKIPTETSTLGLATKYPVYGSTLNTTESGWVIRESQWLSSYNTRNGYGYFNMMDKDGNLLRDGVPVLQVDGVDQRSPSKLFKHSASEGMYFGNVSDDEPAISKRFTFSSRSYNQYYNVTGMYAPAGEVITVQLSEADMEATGGIMIHIGQALYNRKANNIWSGKPIVRMLVILTTFVIDKTTATLENGVYTAYIGSFLGGPIYVQHESPTYSVTISGGVRYSHYIYGYTTEKEFAENAKSSAPYFDLEVWDNGVLLSGPKKYASSFSYEDLTKTAELWDKISLVSTRVTTQGIVFLFDPFVAAGAAVAFPGQGSVNCPASWMPEALNYNSFMNSGTWGNMHEYNHNFQGGWGRGNGGEVTNNALNIVEYSLFTRISSNRKLGASGDGMSGWNRYTSPSWSLNQTLISQRGGNPDYPLNEYSTVLHNFGQEMFMDAIAKQKATSAYTQSYSGWYGALSETTHYDFTYFFSDILHVDIDSEILQNIQSKKYPAFIPAASIYQTGRSFTYYEYEKLKDENGQETNVDNPDKVKSKTKKYCRTAQPYVIPYGMDFTVDLSPYTVNDANQYESGSIVLPDGFSYKIKKVSSPAHGKIKKGKNGIYTYTPDKKHLESGKIYVTLQLINDNDKKAKYEDIELVLEFAQSHEMNKTMLERTTYKFKEAKYTDAVEAYNNKYDGYSEKIDGDNKNPTQNSNTDVWYSYDDPAPTNGVVEVRGKLYIDEAGKYRVAMRGRWNCALYVAVVGADKKPSDVKESDYKLAATIKPETYWNSANFPAKDKLVAGTYMDFDNLEAGQWLYFKEVMICKGEVGKASSFIGLGWGRFENMGGTIDEEGNVTGGVVDEHPTIKYAAAYRSSYEFPSGDFKTDYFYEHKYPVSYSKTYNEVSNKSIVEVKNFTPWDDTRVIEHLIDNDTTNYMHSRNTITAENPFDLTVDLGETITASRVTLYGYDIGKKHTPTTFEFYVGEDLEKLVLVGKFVNGSLSGHNTSFNFTEGEQKFRYYRLYVTDTFTHQYIALREIEFALSVTGGGLFGPGDEMFKYGGKDAWTYENSFATFGQIAVGTKKATFEFEFTGTRFALYSQFAERFGSYTVYIDGKKKAVVDLSEGSGVKLAYITEAKLKDGKHKVKIKCKGKVDYNVAAVGIWL